MGEIEPGLGGVMNVPRRVGSIGSEWGGLCFSNFRDGVEMSSFRCDPWGLPRSRFVGKQEQAVVTAPGSQEAGIPSETWFICSWFLATSRLSHTGDPQPLGLERSLEHRWFTFPALSVNGKACSRSQHWPGEGSLYISLAVVLRALYAPVQPQAMQADCPH